MRVRDVMTSPVVQVTPRDSCRDAARLMAEKGVGALVVMGDGGAVHGLITDRDIVVECVAAGRDPAATSVHDIMPEGYAGSHPVFSVEADLDLDEAATRMRDAGVHRLPVTEGGVRLVGMLSFDEVAMAMRKTVDLLMDIASSYHRR